MKQYIETGKACSTQEQKDNQNETDLNKTLRAVETPQNGNPEIIRDLNGSGASVHNLRRKSRAAKDDGARYIAKSKTHKKKSQGQDQIAKSEHKIYIEHCL